jgi:outer membrane protein assembly factor BamB
MKRAYGIPALLALALGLAGCGADQEVPEISRDNRVAVLSAQSGLVVDGNVADVAVRLSEPVENNRYPAAATGAPDPYHLALPASFRPAWRTGTGEGNTEEMFSLAPPVVVGDMVYTLDAETLVTAVSARDGQIRWQTALKPDNEEESTVSGGITYGEGVLYAATGYAEIVAIDTRKGGILWRKKFTSPFRSAPGTDGKRVYAITAGNEIFALNAADGETVWSQAGVAQSAGLVGGSSPLATRKGMLLAPYSSGEIVAIQAENGRVLWFDSLASYNRLSSLSAISDIVAQPVLDGGILYAISYGGKMLALNIRTGKRLWERDIGGIRTPWNAGPFLYVLTSRQELVCLTEGGMVRWITPLPAWRDAEDKEDPIYWNGPVLAGDRLLLAGSHGHLVFASPYTGEILGSMEIGDAVVSPPVVAGNTLYIFDGDGYLTAYR